MERQGARANRAGREAEQHIALILEQRHWRFTR